MVIKFLSSFRTARWTPSYSLLTLFVAGILFSLISGSIVFSSENAKEDVRNSHPILPLHENYDDNDLKTKDLIFSNPAPGCFLLSLEPKEKLAEAIDQFTKYLKEKGLPIKHVEVGAPLGRFDLKLNPFIIRGDVYRIYFTEDWHLIFLDGLEHLGYLDPINKQVILNILRFHNFPGTANGLEKGTK